ncbi:MAG: sigma-70 family RNA polymerase sigma factor [Akkermansiaceae bacterium]|nr:sigma-70 family RNA polymerase sigma factor [Akkermansiaceae bacterium]MDG2322636.1 sigma-70 family RNA polymerase sigma factor [Akkermansiaceae bacterium]
MNFDAAQQAEFVGQIARHQAALHAYIISLMPGMDGVDDVLQETNLVLWEKRKTFEPGSNFRAWACAIARFKVMNHRRKLAHLGLQLFDDELADQLGAECEAEPEEFDERLRALETCLARLQEPERGLVEHRYFSGSTLHDYAAKSGRPVESLRVSLFRIRAALKKCITGEITIHRSQS